MKTCSESYTLCAALWMDYEEGLEEAEVVIRFI